MKTNNQPKPKEATMAAIKFPIQVSQNAEGRIEILDDNNQTICTCPDFETTQAVYLSLYCAQAAERVQRAAAALSGIGSFEKVEV